MKARNFASLAAAGLMCFSLAACSQPAPVETVQPTEEVVVTEEPTWIPRTLDYSKRPATVVVASSRSDSEIYPVRMNTQDVSVLAPEEAIALNQTFESSQLKVEFVSFEKNLNGSPIVKVRLTNKSAASLNVSYDLPLIINGYAAGGKLQASGEWVKSLEPEAIVEAEIGIETPDVDVIGVYKLTGTITTQDTILGQFSEVSFDVDIDRDGKQAFIYDNSGVLVYNSTEGIQVYLVGYDVGTAENRSDRYGVYVVNNSDEDCSIQLANVTINGVTQIAPDISHMPDGWAHSRSLGYFDFSNLSESIYAMSAEFWIKTESSNGAFTDAFTFVIS